MRKPTAAPPTAVSHHIPLAATAVTVESTQGFALQPPSFSPSASTSSCTADAEEIFGPDTLLVHCETTAGYLRAARALDGHLTATILGDEDDRTMHRELVQILEQKQALAPPTTGV